jgi:glycosyltransferase involved in cell wall biosynthesis
VALEWRAESLGYGWTSAPTAGVERISLWSGAAWPPLVRRLGLLLRAVRRIGRGDYFLCHYDWTEIFLLACWLRLTGSRVFAMIASKFDDKPRRLRTELLKGLVLLPYNGALVGSPRSAEYLRFLGKPPARIRTGYDTLSVERIRSLAGAPPAPAGLSHGARHFVCVARLVPKKNHETLLRAYAAYRALTAQPRDLHLYGDGPEQARIEALAAELGIAAHIHLHGFVQTRQVAEALAAGLALLLPSVEEQFGLVVIEAQAMGLPVIVSTVCGACDELVRSGVNGFAVEPDNVEGIARCMALLGDDEASWRRLAAAAAAGAGKGDVRHFAAAVAALTGAEPGSAA